MYHQIYYLLFRLTLLAYLNNIQWPLSQKKKKKKRNTTMHTYSKLDMCLNCIVSSAKRYGHKLHLNYYRG